VRYYFYLFVYQIYYLLHAETVLTIFLVWWTRSSSIINKTCNACESIVQFLYDHSLLRGSFPKPFCTAN